MLSGRLWGFFTGDSEGYFVALKHVISSSTAGAVKAEGCARHDEGGESYERTSVVAGWLWGFFTGDSEGYFVAIKRVISSSTAVAVKIRGCARHDEGGESYERTSVLSGRLWGFFTGDSEGYFVALKRVISSSRAVAVKTGGCARHDEGGESYERTSVVAGWLWGFFTGDSEGYFVALKRVISSSRAVAVKTGGCARHDEGGEFRSGGVLYKVGCGASSLRTVKATLGRHRCG